MGCRGLLGSQKENIRSTGTLLLLQQQQQQHHLLLLRLIPVDLEAFSRVFLED